MNITCDYCNNIAVYFYKSKLNDIYNIYDFYSMCEKHNTFFFIKSEKANKKEDYALYTQSEYINIINMNRALE